LNAADDREKFSGVFAKLIYPILAFGGDVVGDLSGGNAGLGFNLQLRGL
jgi:hypothetical protein